MDVERKHKNKEIEKLEKEIKKLKTKIEQLEKEKTKKH